MLVLVDFEVLVLVSFEVLVDEGSLEVVEVVVGVVGLVSVSKPGR